MNEKSKLAFINVFLFSLFWALQIVVSKMGFLAGAKALPFTIQSGVVSLIFLILVVLPKNYKEILALPKKLLFSLLLANAINFGIGGFLTNYGSALTSAVNAGFLSKFALVTTIFLAWLILKEKITPTKIMVVLVMIFGSYLISTKGQLIVPQIGDLFIILSCVAYSTGNVLIRKFIKDTEVSGDVVSFLRPIAGLPVLLFFILLSPLYPASIQSVFAGNYFDFSFYPYAIGSGVFAALLWIFLNRTLKVATASYMSMMSMMTPVFVTILAITFLKEQVTPAQLFGGILIISAGFITHYMGINKK
ncbi:DMT family transporter [Patescibacteria group bacterium]|nr:DMT family transporter [Patescibacteria group bacterium]